MDETPGYILTLPLVAPDGVFALFLRRWPNMSFVPCFQACAVLHSWALPRSYGRRRGRSVRATGTVVSVWRSSLPVYQSEHCSLSDHFSGSPNPGPILILRGPAQHQALETVWAWISSEQGRQEYQMRACVEGALSQGVCCCGMRRSRYRGLTKTHLQHVAIAAALNVGRVVAYLEGKKPAKTQVSRIAQARNAASATAMTAEAV